MFLADWVPRKVALDAEQRTGLPETLRRWLRFALQRRGVAPEWIEPVVAEVLIGARDESREDSLRRMLARFDLIPFETLDLDAAVRIYRRCRAEGVTPRGIVDCTIAAVARRSGASLLAHDIDIARVAGVLEIDLEDASLRP